VFSAEELERQEKWKRKEEKRQRKREERELARSKAIERKKASEGSNSKPPKPGTTTTGAP
jgi:hypothetical protein